MPSLPDSIRNINVDNNLMLPGKTKSEHYIVRRPFFFFHFVQLCNFSFNKKFIFLTFLSKKKINTYFDSPLFVFEHEYLKKTNERTTFLLFPSLYIFI